MVNLKENTAPGLFLTRPAAYISAPESAFAHTSLHCTAGFSLLMTMNVITVMIKAVHFARGSSCSTPWQVVKEKSTSLVLHATSIQKKKQRGTIYVCKFTLRLLFTIHSPQINV